MAESFALKAIISAVDKLSPTLKGVMKMVDATKKSLGSIGSAAGDLMGRIGVPLGLLSAALGGASLLGVKNAVMQYTQMGATLDDTSKRLGLTGTQLQELNYLALQSDVSVDGLQNSMSKLNLNIGMAASGKNKELAGLFKKLRIDPKSIKNAADILPRLADAFQRNESPMARARMGMAFFGKTYQEMLPMLVDGSAGIIENFERFKKIGFPLSEKDLKIAAAFDDQLNDLRLSGQGLSAVIGRELVPVLKPVVESIIEWVVANREWLATGIQNAVKDIVKSLKGVDWRGLIVGVKDCLWSIASFVKSIGGLKTALISLAVVINASSILALMKLAGVFVSMAMSAIAPVAPLQVLSAQLLATNAQAAMLVGTVGKLAAIAGVAGAAFAGWHIGSWLNDNVINPGIAKATGVEGQTLGGWIYDKMNPDAGSNLVTPTQKLGGKITVDFNNAPPGMRISDESTGAPGFLATNVGYRSFAKN